MPRRGSDEPSCENTYKALFSWLFEFRCGNPKVTKSSKQKYSVDFVEVHAITDIYPSSSVRHLVANCVILHDAFYQSYHSRPSTRHYLSTPP